jgi:pimeloyl-ACP methyl ester carboxylesterase
MLFAHSMPRRFLTDGSDWSKEIEPTFLGYSIVKWVDLDDDGRYDGCGIPRGRSFSSGRQSGGHKLLGRDRRARATTRRSIPAASDPDTFDKLSTVTMPILVMAADADLLAPPALMRTWAAHLNNYEWATVPDSGHAIAWEHPDMFNEKVLGFIERH